MTIAANTITQNINLASYNKVGPLYEQGASEYMADFYPNDIIPIPDASGDDPANYISFAQYSFQDWCLLVAKSAVQLATDVMKHWQFTTSASNSTLRQIADTFPKVERSYTVKAGDTAASIATQLALTEQEILFLNSDLPHTPPSTTAPGTSITVKLGVTPQMLVIDNPGFTLYNPSQGSGGTLYALGDIAYPVQSVDTLNSIATHFGFTSASALFTGTTLSTDTAALQTGASFNIASFAYANPDNYTQIRVAALFFVHFFLPQDVPYADWYTATIADWNNGGALQNVTYDQQLPVGTALTVPSALYSTDKTAGLTYTTVPGDTLIRIGIDALARSRILLPARPVRWMDGRAFRSAVTAVDGRLLHDSCQHGHDCTR